MNLQEIYWLVGMVGVSGSLVATGINIALYRRNRPDAVKTAVQSAIDPLLKRMDTMEVNSRSQANEQKERIQNLTSEQSSQGRKLDRIEADVKHGPGKHDIELLHGRISDLLKTTSEMKGEQNSRFQQLDRLNQHLMKTPSA